MRLLVVEDDERLAMNLAKAFRETGWGVDVVYDGTDALAAASEVEYDAILLDRMLPSMDGLDVIRELRASRDSAPILMLTARDAIEERVEGLDVGADDYVVKPFSLPELIARVRAITRRPAVNPGARVAAGRLALDTAAREARLGEALIALSAKEFAVLEYLAVNLGQVLSATQILEHVWDSSLEGGDNLVEVYIGRVRRKIRDAGGGEPIQTVRGYGYRLDPVA